MNVYSQLSRPYLKRRAELFDDVFFNRATPQQKREYEYVTRMVDRIQLRQFGPGLRAMEERNAETQKIIRELRALNRKLGV
jgi:hypothetical protein